MYVSNVSSVGQKMKISHEKEKHGGYKFNRRSRHALEITLEVTSVVLTQGHLIGFSQLP